MSLAVASVGAVVNHAGSCACTAAPATVASGLSPRRAASATLIATSAAAPSEIDEELAAVTVPSFAKAGFIFGMRARSARNGSSSWSTSVSPERLLTASGTISSRNAPSWQAASARRTDSEAKASCASRESS